MAFCGNCGNQLQGDERFCVHCGKDTSGKAATAVAVEPAPVAAAPQTPPMQRAMPITPPGQTVAPIPYPPGAVPIVVAQPQKRGGATGFIVLLVLIAAAGYYYYTHKTPPTPAKPAAVDNSALTKQQAFDAHWDAINGFIQISNGKWTNNSQYPVQSVVLECDQFDATGANLDQMRTTLNGPLQPGATDSFNPFQMGAVASNLTRVTCTIVHVKQPNEQAQ